MSSGKGKGFSIVTKDNEYKIPIDSNRLQQILDWGEKSLKRDLTDFEKTILMSLYFDEIIKKKLQKKLQSFGIEYNPYTISDIIKYWSNFGFLIEHVTNFRKQPQSYKIEKVEGGTKRYRKKRKTTKKKTRKIKKITGGFSEKIIFFLLLIGIPLILSSFSKVVIGDEQVRQFIKGVMLLTPDQAYSFSNFFGTCYPNALFIGGMLTKEQARGLLFNVVKMQAQQTGEESYSNNHPFSTPKNSEEVNALIFGKQPKKKHGDPLILKNPIKEILNTDIELTQKFFETLIVSDDSNPISDVHRMEEFLDAISIVLVEQIKRLNQKTYLRGNNNEWYSTVLIMAEQGISEAHALVVRFNRKGVLLFEDPNYVTADNFTDGEDISPFYLYLRNEENPFPDINISNNAAERLLELFDYNVDGHAFLEGTDGRKLDISIPGVDLIQSPNYQHHTSVASSGVNMRHYTRSEIADVLKEFYEKTGAAGLATKLKMNQLRLRFLNWLGLDVRSDYTSMLAKNANNGVYKKLGSVKIDPRLNPETAEIVPLYKLLVLALNGEQVTAYLGAFFRKLMPIPGKLLTPPPEALIGFPEFTYLFDPVLFAEFAEYEKRFRTMFMKP